MIALLLQRVFVTFGGRYTTVFKHGPAEKKVSVFGGLSTKFAPRYLVLLTTGELHIYSSKEDFDARKNPEESVPLNDVSIKKVTRCAF